MASENDVFLALEYHHVGQLSNWMVYILMRVVGKLPKKIQGFF